MPAAGAGSVAPRMAVAHTRRPLAVALATLAVCAGAAGAQDPAPPDPVAAPAGLALRLPDAAWLPGLQAGPTRGIAGPADLLREMRGDGRVEPGDGAERAARLGVVGGVGTTYADAAGRPAVRAWAAQLSAEGGPQAGVDLTRWALRADARRLRVAELERPAGGLVLIRDAAAGATRTAAVFAIDDWLYGIEASADPTTDPGRVLDLVERLGARAPRADVAGAPRLVGVTRALRVALADARAGGRGARGSRDAPAAGSVLAASHLGVEWALAAFSGRRGDLELFRRVSPGRWRAIGDPGGPGCPRIPAPVRAVWGLSDACPTGASPVTRPDDPDAGGADLSPFHGPGVWVWEVDAAGGPRRIAADAAAAGVSTVFVKSGDGLRYWRQFDAARATLEAAGRRVCAWQYVYGRAPVREARVLARAAARGAECLVIDAEGEFEGRPGIGSAGHRAARRYLRELRRRVGRRIPIAMTGFAYVDAHRSFPYSAFAEGPDAVDVFMPQVYWRDFGVGMASALRRAMRWNAVYGVPVAPVAGTYRGERPADLRAFRCLAAELGADGVSYWSLQHTRAAQLPALGLPTDCAPARRRAAALAERTLSSRYARLSPGASGDPVVWLQSRLRTWGAPIPRTGFFRSRTRAAVTAFQRARGLPARGVVDGRTWDLLLQRPRPPERAPAPIGADGGDAATQTVAG